MSLFEIQQRLKVPKSNYSDYGGFSYRSIEDIEEALKPLLKEFELTMIIHDEMVEVGGRVYVKAVADLWDKSDKLIGHGQAFAREALEKTKADPAQLTGAASSYARKYCLSGLFLIDDTADADQGSSDTPPPAKESKYYDWQDKVDKEPKGTDPKQWFDEHKQGLTSELTKDERATLWTYFTQLKAADDEKAAKLAALKKQLADAQRELSELGGEEPAKTSPVTDGKLEIDLG